MEENVFPLANLMDEIASEENLSASFDYVISHLEHKEQRAKYRPQKERMLDRLKAELHAGEFRVREYATIHVTDGPKERDVQAPKVYYRVGCHAVMVVVEKHLYPTLIHNTAASIKGRGMHWLHHIICEDMRSCEERMAYYYKCDIYHYYDNISQEIMMRQIREYIADERVLRMLDGFVTLLGQGLSKGLRSSQSFANLHLSEIDRLMESLCERYTDKRAVSTCSTTATATTSSSSRTARRSCGNGATCWWRSLASSACG